MAAYPAAPWTLCGFGVQSLFLVDAAAVRPIVPPELEIVCFLPGKTIGVVAYAHYGVGSVLQYNELIVAPAVAKLGSRRGVWISHIYVDHPDSVAGGREIWGLPKELADFHWSADRRFVSASQSGGMLCSLSTGRRWPLWRGRLAFPSFSQLSGGLLEFTGRASARLSLARGVVDVPEKSPLSVVPLRRAWLTIGLEDMTLVAGAPSPVASPAIAVA